MKTLQYLLVASILGGLIVFIRCETGEDSSGSGQGGSLARFTIVGDYLYTVEHENMNLFDISDAANPGFVKKKYVGFGVETIFPFDSLLFLGTSIGMYIYDISDPELPARLSYFEHVRSCDPVVTDGKYAYVTLNSLNDRCGRNTNELQVIDITDPMDPVLLKKYPMDRPRGLGISDSLLFICDEDLEVYNASDPEDIRLIREFDIPSKDVIPLGEILLVVGEGGFFQYLYSGDTMQLLSKINIDGN